MFISTKAVNSNPVRGVYALGSTSALHFRPLHSCLTSALSLNRRVCTKNMRNAVDWTLLHLHDKSAHSWSIMLKLLWYGAQEVLKK